MKYKHIECILRGDFKFKQRLQAYSSVDMKEVMLGMIFSMDNVEFTLKDSEIEYLGDGVYEGILIGNLSIIVDEDNIESEKEVELSARSFVDFVCDDLNGEFKETQEPVFNILEVK